MHVEMGLSRLELQILLAIVAGKGGDTRGFSITGKALSSYMGGKWGTYRHRVCVELERKGMLIIHPLAVMGKNVRFYGLADGTRDWLEAWQKQIIGGESVAISNMFSPEKQELEVA